MPHKFTTIIEPFRIKAVESIHFTTYEHRRKALSAAGYNLFMLSADDVLIDLLTDSGTGAMSSDQWAGMMRGDESYAGARSFYRFEASVRGVTGFQHVIPTHQGRAAERILFGALCEPGDVVPNNSHFDTTRANVEHRGAEARDLVIEAGHHPAERAPFKGNMDVAALEETIAAVGPEHIPLIMLTVTNNTGGGQPVSMDNIKAVSALCRKHSILFFLDACRFAENAYFIKLRDPTYSHATPGDIAHEMFGYADGCTMSAKKDGLANIGGFLALNDPPYDRPRYHDLAQRCKNQLILTEGFPTYGGLAGYDLEAIAVGLQEVLHEDYLRYRIRSTEYLGNKLTEAGVPIVQPPGGHAIYIDARAMLPHVSWNQYPGQALAAALYLEAGIRSVEIGQVAFGRVTPDGADEPSPLDLVRLTIPRRTYTQSHIDYVAEAIEYVNRHKEKIGGSRSHGRRQCCDTSPLALRRWTLLHQRNRDAYSLNE